MASLENFTEPNEKWDELVKKNEKLIDKHEEILAKFDIKDGK
jgi:hypothetical protein